MLHIENIKYLQFFFKIPSMDAATVGCSGY